MLELTKLGFDKIVESVSPKSILTQNRKVKHKLETLFQSNHIEIKNHLLVTGLQLTLVEESDVEKHLKFRTASIYIHMLEKYLALAG